MAAGVLDRPWTDAWERAVRLRLYCPSCGEVRGRTMAGTPEFTQDPWQVLGHFRYVYEGQRTVRTLCHGGPVDPVKDRAP